MESVKTKLFEANKEIADLKILLKDANELLIKRNNEIESLKRNSKRESKEEVKTIKAMIGTNKKIINELKDSMILFKKEAEAVATAPAQI